jgi:AcrR family transcriptional regulator
MVTQEPTRRAYSGGLRREQAEQTRQRILTAARALLTNGTYSSVTMEDIAREAGVAPQTLYAVFGNKLRLAEAVVDAGWPHIPPLIAQMEEAAGLRDPEEWIRTMARLHRLVFEPCADLIRFTGISGDPTLIARYDRIQQGRYERIRALAPILERSARRRPDLSAEEAVAVAWTMLGPDHYGQLVFDRGWTPDRYEEWVGQALVDLILTQR